MLNCSGLHKRFHDNIAVQQLTFHVKEKEVFALLGHNGSGKSTTFKMILGLLPLDAGEIHFNKKVRIGYAPEIPSFPPHLTAEKVLAYYAELQRIRKPERTVEIKKCMTMLSLEPTNTKVRFYSKGMRQRLNLAQALLGDPDFLILDEPTSGLDANGRVEVLRLLKELKRFGKTILLNSHILSEVERIADRGIIMKNGDKIASWCAGDL